MFECLAFAYTRQDKLDDRAIKCVFMCYPEGVMGHMLWSLEPTGPKCIINRGVVFNEEKMANLIKYSEEDISSEKNFKIEVETFYKSHEEENQELQV